MDEQAAESIDTLEVMLEGIKNADDKFRQLFKLFHDSINAEKDNPRISTKFNESTGTFIAELYGAKIKVGIITEFNDDIQKSLARLVAYREATDINGHAEWEKLDIGRASFTLDGRGTASLIIPKSKSVRSRQFSRAYVLTCLLKHWGINVHREVIG